MIEIMTSGRRRRRLSFGFWLGWRLWCRLVFGGMAPMSAAWMANHPELPDPSTLPPRRRRSRPSRRRLPKMLRRKDKKEDALSDDDDVPLLLDRQASDDDSDKGVELTDRGKPESKAPTRTVR